MKEFDFSPNDLDFDGDLSRSPSSAIEAGPDLKDFAEDRPERIDFGELRPEIGDLGELGLDPVFLDDFREAGDRGPSLGDFGELGPDRYDSALTGDPAGEEPSERGEYLEFDL